METGEIVREEAIVVTDVPRDSTGKCMDYFCWLLCISVPNNQEVNSREENLNDIYLEGRLQRKTLVELLLARWVQRLDMVDKSINPLRTHSSRFFVSGQSRQTISS